MNYIRKNYSIIILSLILFITCFILYFINLGEFSFIDYDETKYVTIARDTINANNWFNLKLNENNFFECPPLLFWIMNISFFFFGKISTFVARIPFTIYCLIGIIGLLVVLSKIFTKFYAMVICLILSTCLGFLIFSHIATNDMLFTISAMISVLFSYLIIFNKYSNKTPVLWFFVYMFSGIAVLSGGLFGILPLIITLTIHIFSGKQKTIFKPINILPGIAIFIILISFWITLIIKSGSNHSLKDFLSAYSLIKQAGVQKYISNILMFILGFMPWTCAVLWIIGSRFKDIRNSVLSYFKYDSQDTLTEKWTKLRKTEKFLSVNTIVFFTTAIFALLYGAKYTYLILFLMFPASCISGHYWYEYIFRKKGDESIFFATILPNVLFILCSIILLFGHSYIKKLSIYGVNSLIIPITLIFSMIPLISIFSVILKGRLQAFISNLILMICLSFVITPKGFNFVMLNSGEADLIKFAGEAREAKVNLSSFTGSRKYSLEYYFDNKVNFHSNKDFKWLKESLNTNKDDYIVVEMKDLWEIEDQKIKYLLVDSGKRYCLIKHLPKALEKEMEQEGEPELTIL